MKRCISMLKPIDGICQHSELVCVHDRCLNFCEFEYWSPDPSVPYPLGTIRHSEGPIEMFTNAGWMRLKDCVPNFMAWGVIRGDYAVRTVHIQGEECGCFEKFDQKISNIKRLVGRCQRNEARN